MSRHSNNTNDSEENTDKEPLILSNSLDVDKSEAAKVSSPVMAPKYASDESLVAQSIRIAVVVTSYWIISISMVFLNKYLLSSEDLKLEAPVFITWFQCIVTVGICFGASFATTRFNIGIDFPPSPIEMKTIFKVLPLSIIFISMIAFNNLCIKYLSVQFYNVGRSLSTVFNVICSYVILGQTTSYPALGCCGIIISGFLLGIDQEDKGGSLSVAGVVFGVMASLFVALNAIYQKRILPAVENNVWRLTLYNNLNACVLFVPLSLVNGEISEIFHFGRLFDGTFWFLMILAGVCGFLIGYVTTLQIKYTSPLTHNVSGTAKAAAQTVIACWYWNDHKSFWWWVSNVLVLAGSALYTYVKQREMASQEHSVKKSVPSEDPSEAKSSV